MINIKELKNKFYNQHFTEFLDFVNNTDLRFDWNLVLNNTLSRLNKMMQEKGEPLYSITREEVVKDGKKSTLIKGPGLKANAEEQEAVVSIEEFFDIVEYNKELAKLVDRILTYMEDQKGNGSEPELAQTTEDLIHKEICRYFWEKQGKLRLEYKEQEKEQKNEQEKGKENDATDVQEQDQTQETNLKKFYDYDWLDTKDATAKNIISGPLFLLMGRYHYTISLLHICRKIRNRDIHGEERFFGLRDGYIINCFRLFTYIATVMLLRRNLQEQYNLPKYKFVPRDLKVIAPENAEVKLWCGREEITPDSHKNNPLSYKVFWYKSYKLEIEIKEKLIENFEPNWTYQTPTAACYKGKLEVIPNDSQGSSLLRNSSFHEVMKAVNHGLEDMRRIGDTAERIEQQTGDISDKLDILEEIYRFWQEKYGQQEIFNHQVTELLKLIVEQNGKGTDVKTIIDQEGIKGRRKWIRWIFTLCTICLAIGLALYFYRDEINDYFLTAEEIIERTDAQLRELSYGNQNSDSVTFDDLLRVNSTYIRALKKYKERIEKDSTDLNAHIALATMLMRGKGYYDLSEALKYAKSAASLGSKRAQGLYCYILLRMGELEKTRDYLHNQVYLVDDEYIKLSNIILSIKDSERMDKEQRLNVIKDCMASLFQMHNQEAMLTVAQLCYHGIKDENDDEYDTYYYWVPNPMMSFGLLNTLATDSIHPFAFALLSDFYNCLDRFSDSYLTGVFALACGYYPEASLLKQKILSECNLEDEETLKQLETISNIEEQGNLASLSSRIVNHLFRQKSNIAYIKEALSEIDSLIAIEKSGMKEEIYYPLDALEKHRISLCLMCGYINKATNLVAEREQFSDTLAIRYYLEGVCLAKGYNNIEKDTIASDSLINLSAELGYPEAVLTRFLRKREPISYYVNEDAFDPVTRENRVKVELNDKKKLDIFPDEMGYTVFNDFGVAYGIDSLAVVADSIWHKNPKLAMALAEYWRPCYIGTGFASPYIPYCPIFYTTMYRYFQLTFGVVGFRLNGSPILEEKLNSGNFRSEQILFELPIGLTDALEHFQPKIWEQLCCYYLHCMDISNAYNELLYLYEHFVPNYDKHSLYTSPTIPVYAY